MSSAVPNKSEKANKPPKRERTVLHVDINSYFATMLQQETPALRGRPVGVLKSAGRTCIIASSKEAKAMGVQTASTVKEAKEKCPDIILVPAQFEMYLSATKKLKAIFESLSPEVEVFSLDEAFIFYDSLVRLYNSPVEFGQKIQRAIKEVLGEWVTCNVGIGPNKFMAKMISEISPKGSVSQVTDQNKDQLLATTSFKDVCGIGFRLERRLRRFGVTNPYQINFLDDDTLESAFGPFWSQQLRKMGRGEEPLFLARPALKQNSHMKSVGRSITGFKLWKTECQVKQVIYNLTDEVIYKVRKMNLAGRQVGISLVGSWSNSGKGASPLGWNELPSVTPSWGNYVTQKNYLRHTKEMYQVITDQLMVNWVDKFEVIKIAVYLGLLKPWDDSPKQLWKEWWQQEKLSEAVDKITQKYGLFTVKPATLLDHDLIRPEVTGFLGDQKYQFGE